MAGFFSTFSKNLLNCFRGYNLLWHLLAIILTVVSVTSGFDWLYFNASRGALLQSFLFPAVSLGSVVPIVAPLALSVFGKVRTRAKALVAAKALVQAALLGLLVCSFYKALTGRVHPPRVLTEHTIDISRVFRFGFLRGGVFWGWPSSHTMIAFAMSVALATLYPKKRIVRYAAVLYALYIGFGVSVSIHWFSDFLAGAVIGTLIGVVVGKSFRRAASEQAPCP